MFLDREHTVKYRINKGTEEKEGGGPDPMLDENTLGFFGALAKN